ncbi:MAG: hypothetical protein JXA77_13565 [Bacteroidales bacterium]|nr:hypothetical protein [Bacteroidales bacterium]
MCNNKAGKPPGAVNKLSRDTRQTITEFLQSSWPEVEQEFHRLRGKDKLSFYRDLLQYSIPRLQAVNVGIDFERLPDSQLELIIDRLINTPSEKV